MLSNVALPPRVTMQAEKQAAKHEAGVSHRAVLLAGDVLVLGCWLGSTYPNLQKYNAGIYLLVASYAFKLTTTSMLK